MGIRADWHLDELEVDQSDPFDVRQAEPVDLTSPEFLRSRVRELLAREGKLADQGTSCSLKDRADTCCSACPLRGTRRVHPIRELCKLGTEQERALMNLVVADG